MKNKIQRSLSCILILSVLMSIFPLLVSASDIVASGYCGGEGDGTNLEWTLDNEGALIISGSGAMENYDRYGTPWYAKRSSIKKIIVGDGLTTIGDYAFWYCDSLNSVTIPSSVITIGDYAFYSCDSLTSVIMPNSVAIIGVYAFGYCNNLSSVTIPNSVISIGDYAFCGCERLTSVTIPDSVTAIGDSTFYGCYDLNSVTIPNSVTTIGDSAFRFCYGLTSVTIPDSVTSIGDYAFHDCRNLTFISIPDSVTTIGNEVFRWCFGLTAVTIGNSVTTIGNEAFYTCDRLTSVYFESNAPTVGTNVFKADTATLYYIPGMTGWMDSEAYDASTGTWHGYKLEIWEERAPIAYGHCGGEGDGSNLQWTIDQTGTLTISGTGIMADFGSSAPWYPYRNEIKTVIVTDGVTSIEDMAFASCTNLTSVDISNDVMDIGIGAFHTCTSLTSIEIPTGVTTIKDATFQECNKLTSVNIPNCVTSIGNYVFASCFDLLEVNIPMGVNSIGYAAFCNCYSLTSVTLPDSVLFLGWNAFSGCTGLETVIISGSMRTIEDGTFRWCSNLNSVTIPECVTAIEDGAFLACKSLTDVYFEGNAPSVAIDSLTSTGSFDKTVTLHYVTGTNGWTGSAAYNATAGTWNGYNLAVWKEKAYLAYGYCGSEGDGTNLEWSLDNEGTLTITGTGAMRNCDFGNTPWFPNRNSIKEVVIGRGVTTIGNCAFYDCTGLTSVTIPDSVTTIGYGAFFSCTSLTSVQIPNGVSVIDILAFNDCTNLTSVEIPDSVTTIGDSAFSYCTNLTSVDIPESVTIIGNGMFSCCTSLTSVEIPNSVITIGSDAFFRCTSLTSVEIPNSVTTIGDYAFYDCTSFTSVKIPDSVTTIGERTFYDCNSLTEVYLSGDAPAVTGASSTHSSFDATVTLYYIPGTTGWTDSAAHNATTGKWNGYKLAVWKEKAYLTYGYCGGEGDGTNLEWTLDNDGTLTITGTGTMGSAAPWSQYKDLIKSIVIGEGVTSIGYNVFSYCRNLTSLDLPTSLASIGQYAFQYCTELTSVCFGDHVSSIGDYAFMGCSGMITLTLSNSVEYIGTNAFSNCRSLTSLVIPDNVYQIKDFAFFGCDGLTTVTMGSTVNGIGTSAFLGCTNLKSVYFKGNAPNVGTSAFESKIVTLYRMSNTKYWNDYYNASSGRWHDYKLEIWKLSYNVNVIGGSGSGVYTEGDAVTITADPPEEGMQFKEWTGSDGLTFIGGTSKTDASAKFTMPAQAVSVTATYKNIPHIHSESSNWSFNDTEHWKVCSDPTCQIVLNATKEAHHGDTADCVNLAICVDCGQAYGNLADHSPVKLSGQPATCTDDGWFDYYQCSCCDAFFSDEACTNEIDDLDAWKTSDGMIVSSGHAFSSDWNYNSNEHWHDAVCGHYVTSDVARHDYGRDYICDTCGHRKNHSGGQKPQKPVSRPKYPFGDLDMDAWYYEGVLYCLDNELMNGISNDSFNPNGQTTRAMVVTILWRLSGKPTTNSDMIFVDVPQGQWYSEAIRWAASEGIVCGIGDSKFAPDSFVTREQLATMIYRYEIYTYGEAEIENSYTTFADNTSVSLWAQNAVNWCSNHGIVNGKGGNLFAPQDLSTRAELAAILHRYAKR